MEIDITSKLPSAGVSVFARMTAMANEYNAINLAQGFPDFNPPPELVEYLHEAALTGMNQYASMPGLLSLREQVCRRLEGRYAFVADPDHEVTITAGATQALFTILSAFVRPGDKVLIFEPAYDSYAPAVLSNGGIPEFIRLEAPAFRIPMDELEDRLKKEKYRLILINNPHNPCGSILSRDDLHRIGEITASSDSILVWDEVYDYLVFDHKEHCSALQDSGIMDRSIVVFSMGKTLHNTGWKIGYTVARPYLTREIRKLHQFTVFSVNTPAQAATAKFMEMQPDFFAELTMFYQRKRDYFLKEVSGGPFDFFIPEGSYFALADYSGWYEGDDESAAAKLVRELGVAAIPISAFYHDGYDPRLLRFCFAKKEETLKAAALRLAGHHDPTNPR
jgi:methionine aminotransferase